MTLEFRSFRLRLGFSFFAVLCLLLLSSGGTTALLCFSSAMLHECGHLLLLFAFGAGVEEVSFGAGGIVILRRGCTSCGAGKESLIALGGIFVNCLLCFAAKLWYDKAKTQTALVLLVVNGALALLNLLPVQSLDFYRVLDLCFGRLGVAGRETVLRRVSLCAVVFFAACCAAMTACGVRNPSLWAVCGYLVYLHWKRS